MISRAKHLSLALALMAAAAPAAHAGICLGDVTCWNLDCNNDIECTSTGACYACSSGEQPRHDAEAGVTRRQAAGPRDFREWLDMRRDVPGPRGA